MESQENQKSSESLFPQQLYWKQISLNYKSSSCLLVLAYGRRRKPAEGNLMCVDESLWDSRVVTTCYLLLLNLALQGLLGPISFGLFGSILQEMKPVLEG